jgi:hypothetical protein
MLKEQRPLKGYEMLNILQYVTLDNGSLSIFDFCENNTLRAGFNANKRTINYTAALPA